MSAPSDTANRDWIDCPACEGPGNRRCRLCHGDGGWWVSGDELVDQEDDPHEGRPPLTPRDPPSSDDPDGWDDLSRTVAVCLPCLDQREECGLISQVADRVFQEDHEKPCHECGRPTKHRATYSLGGP